MAAVTGSQAPPKHGFGNYLEYLNSIQDKWCEYESLTRYLSQPRVSPHTCVAMRDILLDGSYSQIQPFTYLESNPWPHDDGALDPTSAVITALRTWSSNVRTRTIYISPEIETFTVKRFRRLRLPRSLIDAIGLELNVEPQFFESVLLDQGSPRNLAFVRVGDCWFNLLENILIDGKGRSICRRSSNPLNSADKFNLTGLIISDSRRWSREKAGFNFLRNMFNDAPSLYDRDSQWTLAQNLEFVDHQIYDKMLCQVKNSSAMEDFHHCFITLCRLQLTLFLYNVHVLRTRFSTWDEIAEVDARKTDDEIINIWTQLRSRLEEFVHSRRTSSRFATTKFPTLTDKRAFEEIDQDLEDAKILEQHIRDRLQILTGTRSLEESRRSIQEGKRVQLLTVLAFIFVPVSLATSVFGMNVQEINGSGKNIWVFALTAVIMTVTAVLSWRVLSWLLNWRKDQINLQNTQEGKNKLLGRFYPTNVLVLLFWYLVYLCMNIPYQNIDYTYSK